MSKGSTAYTDLTDTQKSQITAGVGIYAKHLTDLGEKAKGLGKDKEAGTYNREAENIKDEIAAQLEKSVPEFKPTHRIAIERGLAMFIKNLRAAKGTVRGLGKDTLAEEFEFEAEAVAKDLVTQFSEQVVMPGVTD